jgi:Meiotically up-regulated gene 113
VIYFVQACDPLREDYSPIKIGFTSDPDLRERVAGIQTGNPYPLRVLGVIAEGTQEQEFALHQRFASRRLQGEWFDADKVLRRFITKNTVGYLWGKHEVDTVLTKAVRNLRKEGMTYQRICNQTGATMPQVLRACKGEFISLTANA